MTLHAHACKSCDRLHEERLQVIMKASGVNPNQDSCNILHLTATKSCRLHACTSNLGRLGRRVEHAAEDGCTCLQMPPQSPAGTAKLVQIRFETVPLENSGMDCRADIPDLEPGLDYLLRVSAVNAQGPSPASEPGLISSHFACPIGLVLQHTAMMSPMCGSTAPESCSQEAIQWWIAGWPAKMAGSLLVIYCDPNRQVTRDYWLTVVLCVQHASAQRRRRLLHQSHPMSRFQRPPIPCSWSGRSLGAVERLSPATLSRWHPQMLCSRCRGRPRLRR